jgi:hypothetical protein
VARHLLDEGGKAEHREQLFECTSDSRCEQSRT